VAIRFRLLQRFAENLQKRGIDRRLFARNRQTRLDSILGLARRSLVVGGNSDPARRRTSWIANAARLFTLGVARRVSLPPTELPSPDRPALLEGRFAQIPAGMRVGMFTRELKPTQSRPLPRRERDAHIKEVIRAYSSARARACACGIRLGVSDAFPCADSRSRGTTGETRGAITKTYESFRFITVIHRRNSLSRAGP